MKTFIILGLIGWFNTVHAMDISQPLPKLLAKDVLHYGPSHAFFAAFDEAVEGNCEPLLELINDALDSDAPYAAKLVAAEMYDRAICVSYSPEKSFHYFKESAETGNDNFFALVGWKYFFGHGVDQSLEQSNAFFKKYLTAIASFNAQEITIKTHDILKDRPLPSSLKRAINWLTDILSTEEGRIKFAYSLTNGTARYYDESPLENNYKGAYSIYQRLSSQNNIKAQFLLAKLLLSGKVASASTREAEMLLEHSANYGHTDAMIALAHYHQTGQHGFKQTHSYAYQWLYAAQQLGANVEAKMNHLKKIIERTDKEIAQQELPWGYRPHSCRAK